MKTNEALKLIGEQEFLDKVYSFSYHRCNTSHDAEELCSEIILAVISAISRTDTVESLYAFVWTVARRVYADFSKKRSRQRQLAPIENAELISSPDNEIEDFVEAEEEKEQLKRIFRSISFLSRAYREVMIMYYLDGKSIGEIASSLSVSETAVKQRLFSARNNVRKEVKTMTNKDITLKPVKLAFCGCGNPIGNIPSEAAQHRTFSQSLIYLCKSKPKTARELSEELGVPMLYGEEELEIQCAGMNGAYGCLKQLDDGRYISNILIADPDEYIEANDIYLKHLPELTKRLKRSLEKHKDEILSFPFLSEQTDTRFILWTMLSRAHWNLTGDINKILRDKHFSGIKLPSRPFSTVAHAYTADNHPSFAFYGCDGIHSRSIEGFKQVKISNVYGVRLDAHFHCDHNISTDETLLLTLRAITPLSIDSLNENEKEIASKAIEVGYLRRDGNMLKPKILIANLSDEESFVSLSNLLIEDTSDIVQMIADELAEYMKSHIPKHLICEYELYSECVASVQSLSGLIEACISEGLLAVPENRISAEGVLMLVEK